jgi:hypothetical protein
MLAESIDKLGQFPIVQIAIGFLIVVGGLLALRQGSRDKEKDQPADVSEQRWYFDGPIKAVLDALEGLYRETKEFRREQREAADERREQHKEHMQVVRQMLDRLPTRRR